MTRMLRGLTGRNIKRVKTCSDSRLNCALKPVMAFHHWKSIAESRGKRIISSAKRRDSAVMSPCAVWPQCICGVRLRIQA